MSNSRRSDLLQAIEKAEFDADQEAVKAAQYEQRGANLREQVKFTARRLNKLADIQDEKAAPHREAERAHRVRADKLRADLKAFDNAPENMTVEQRLAALEERL